MTQIVTSFGQKGIKGPRICINKRNGSGNWSWTMNNFLDDLIGSSFIRLTREHPNTVHVISWIIKWHYFVLWSVTYVFDVSSRELYKSNYSIIDMVKMKISSSDESEVLPDGKYGESAFAFEPEYTDDEVRQLLSQSQD